MNRSERTYSQLFGLLRDVPPAPSFTPEEIQSLIERPAATTLPDDFRPTVSPMTRRIAMAAALLAVSITGVWLWPIGPTGSEPSPAATVASGPSSPARNAPNPPRQMSDAREAGPVAAASGTTQKNEAKVEATLASTGVRFPPHPAPPTIERPMQSHPLAEATHLDAKETDTVAATQPEITTLPMLELSPEELKGLGVRFVDGGIETDCEEYYTLATEQDRTRFARMGMDTTQRTGIVRRRLAIDTFGLTTTSQQWSRVERYSRIAPIIALNSYVRDEHYHTVVLNVVNHSPIMDLAKRSIDSMATFLPEAFTADNIDRVMHDSDQANPARILVPVHIRMGDEPINGSTKRRGADIILWYYPTPEFAAALPARYRISLQRELNVLADVVECNLPPKDACRQMTGEPLLVNYCKRTSGALGGLSLSPNPAHGAIVMRYMLESQRTVAARLYDIRGEFIRELIPSATVGAGNHSASVQLGDVAPGAYRIVLRSEQGEQVSERLIVQ